MSTTTIAGALLIAVPLAFKAPFALLAARFDYPDIPMPRDRHRQPD